MKIISTGGGVNKFIKKLIKTIVLGKKKKLGNLSQAS